jgi:hypothetical protein
MGEMTLEQWRNATDPDDLFAHLRGRAFGPLFLRYAIACCRRVWPQLDSDCRRAVEAVERYAYGETGFAELEAVIEVAGRPPAVTPFLDKDLVSVAREVGVRTAGLGAETQEEGRLVQCDLIRQMFSGYSPSK